jgi:transcriptional regulator with PAS, ATPase and Fis domain
VSAADRWYAAFFFTVSAPPAAGERAGVNILTRRQVDAECRESIFHEVNLPAQYLAAIGQATEKDNPVFLRGEAGTGKAYLAKTIYLRGAHANAPFVSINCSQLSARAWTWLLTRANSPLCDTGNVLFFQNVDALEEARRHQLLAFFLESRVPRRNYLLFSCRDSADSEIVTEYINRLGCFPITTTPLRAHPVEVDRAVQLFLNRYAIRCGVTAGIRDDALATLRQYRWPQNYLQFQRIMERLAGAFKDRLISSGDVKEALRAEVDISPSGTEAAAGVTLDLSRPLSEINRQIIRLLLEENGGNQSLTAKSLGLSRTTLWRMLKE